MWGKSTKQRKSAVRRKMTLQLQEQARLDLLARAAGTQASTKKKAPKKRLAKKVAASLGTVVGRLVVTAPLVQNILKPRRARKTRGAEA